MAEKNLYLSSKLLAGMLFNALRKQIEALALLLFYLFLRPFFGPLDWFAACMLFLVIITEVK